MATKVLDVVIRLRRDNDYNYAKVQDSFIPEDGEVCLVDTARSGLCAIVGDGVSTYGNLVAQGYANEIFVKGYLYDGVFYSDSTHTTALNGNMNRVYIDIGDSYKIYYYDGAQYIAISGGVVAQASEEVAGIMKLYTTKGENTDGTMTQKAITKELNEKFEMNVVPEDELLIFATDIA